MWLHSGLNVQETGSTVEKHCVARLVIGAVKEG